jgi:hypothetical protein
VRSCTSARALGNDIDDHRNLIPAFLTGQGVDLLHQLVIEIDRDRFHVAQKPKAGICTLAEVLEMRNRPAGAGGHRSSTTCCNSASVMRAYWRE